MLQRNDKQNFDGRNKVIKYAMSILSEIKPEYITDADGKKRSVVLPIDQFESLIEDIEDLAIVAERKDEDTITQEDLLGQLKKDGLL